MAGCGRINSLQKLPCSIRACMFASIMPAPMPKKKGHRNSLCLCETCLTPYPVHPPLGAGTDEHHGFQRERYLERESVYRSSFCDLTFSWFRAKSSGQQAEVVIKELE